MSQIEMLTIEENELYKFLQMTILKAYHILYCVINQMPYM